MRSVAPATKVVNSSTTNGSNVDGADWNTTSSEEILKRSLKINLLLSQQINEKCKPEVNYVGNNGFVWHKNLFWIPCRSRCSH
jgi:hypothetical protein